MSNKYLLLVLLAFSAVILTACASNNQDTGRRVPEVMMGEDCGFDKLKCCATTPICNYGQECCADPNNATKNYCSDNCECGNNEEFCCAGNKCNGNAVCQNGLCVTCGGKDQACCSSGDSCAKGLICFNDKCSECGLSGEPCCPGTNSCLLKAGERSECLANLCSDCGFDGNPPCTTGDKCLPGQILTAKSL